MRVRQGVIDEVRRMRHFRERSSDPATIDRVAVEGGDPARLVERQDELRRLVALVAALPERERILIGVGLEGGTVRAVAQAIGIHETRASRLRSRAVARLRAGLASA
jgi:RNA polymerase sigma factor (sigma-70 family)